MLSVVDQWTVAIDSSRKYSRNKPKSNMSSGSEKAILKKLF